jgi:AcrR family transcriptional regulator
MEALDLTNHPRVEPLIRPRGESQRARLLVAAFDLAGDQGVQRTAVAEIVKAAGVSRGTFYELFSSKQDCFIHAYRFASDLLLQVVTDANREATDGWQVGLAAGVRALLCALAYSPRFARAGLLEIQNAGEVGLAERHATLTRFAEALGWLFERGHRDDPRLQVPSAEARFVLAAGTEQLLCAYVRDGRIDELPELERVLVAAAEASFLGSSDEGQAASANGGSGPRTGERSGESPGNRKR